MVEEVDTAIPAFVGYTDKAERKTPGDLTLVPTKINSFKEYELYFGKPHDAELEVVVSTDEQDHYVLTNCKMPALIYLLYYAVKNYFDNEGTPCCILSVGTYQPTPTFTLFREKESSNFGLLDGVNRLVEVDEIALLIIPEAVQLAENEYSMLVQCTLQQCHILGNRFAIFDLYHGHMAEPDLLHNRNLFGFRCLRYGSVYYPFLKTTMNYHINPDESNVMVNFGGELLPLGKLKQNNRLLAKFVRGELLKRFVTIPCAGTVAAVYVSTDKSRGVWKSPANLALRGVSEPSVSIDNQMQDLLYKDPDDGKSINSIRTFANRGILVWGARTLAGNEAEWRYVSVVRFTFMVKESLVKSTHWVVYEPNDSQTWNKVVDMIEGYLTLKWKAGALAGLSHYSAFYVKCGLGTTMTEQDLTDGKIGIEVGLAILRPGEFIVFKFFHQKQKD
jgi:phage tail sheath protein FI